MGAEVGMVRRPAGRGRGTDKPPGVDGWELRAHGYKQRTHRGGGSGDSGDTSGHKPRSIDMGKSSGEPGR